jgi:pyruvate,water dikinase
LSSTYLRDWPAIYEAGPQRVGGKAWNLARLARYGFSVLELSAIDGSAYRDWLDNTGLEAELLAAVAEPEAVAGVIAKLQACPVDLNLSGLPEGPLAVRSSAPQEDSAHASFAGVHSSCLNVQGVEAVEQAIRTVWLSLWSPAAIAYRERIGLPHDEAAMAVLIMPLIPAKASGIAFSRDPISGRDDRMVIHATHGLGESLVRGETNGDEIMLGEHLLDDRLSLVEMKSGDKTQRVDPAPGGGTQSHRLDADLTPVLNQAQALELGEQLRLAAIALDYAKPDYDLEWAWDGDRFWLLQARPITAANRCTYPELQSQPDIWSRGNTRDVVPDPLSPFDWSASRRLVNAMLRQGFELAGLKIHPGVQRAGLFHGRLYLNLSLLQWEGYSTLGVTPEAMNRLVGGHQPAIKVSSTPRQRLAQGVNLLRYLIKSPARRKLGRAQLDEVMAQVARWNNLPSPQDDGEYSARINELTRYTRSAHDLHFLQGAASGALNFLVDLIESSLPGEGHALAAALMAGGPPSVTAQQGQELVAIAQQATADSFTRQWLEQRLPGSECDWNELPESNPLRLAFCDFLERYGHRGVYETYTRNPRLREQYGYLLDSLLDLAETDLDALERAQQEARERARARVIKALPWWKRPMLGSMVRSAKAGSNEREGARSAMIAQLEPARRLMLGLGGRWVDAGWLKAAEDILYLLYPEINAVLDGVLPGPALALRVADRKGLFKKWQTQEAPEVILEQSDGSLAEQADEHQVHPTNGDCFTGVPVGAGRVTGAARLLTCPQQGEKLARGEILVVPSTDPAWTPLFLKAGGLVMETGGYLSHGAIVAREFGIPAVVNLPGILQLLQDGDRLQVDGAKGTVRRIKQ